MKYRALFVIFEKSGKILNSRLLQIIGGALWSKVCQRKMPKMQKKLPACINLKRNKMPNLNHSK